MILQISDSHTLHNDVPHAVLGEFTMKQSLSLNRGFVMGLDVYFMKNSKSIVIYL